MTTKKRQNHEGCVKQKKQGCERVELAPSSSSHCFQIQWFPRTSSG